jgi:diguanylate cyclase (GGDEF)-like protein/PAS domain S-box-containing protein
VNNQNRARRRALKQRLVITAVALAAALVWFVIATLLLARETAAVRASSVAEQHLSDVRDNLQSLFIKLSDAETGQRGYLLTRNDRYLGPYRAAAASIPALLELLSTSQASVADFDVRAEEIARLTRRKMAELADTIRLDGDGQYAAALALVKTDQGEKLMERLRSDFNALDAALAAEGRAVRERTVQRVALRQKLALLAGAALVACIGLMALQAWLLFAAQRRYALALAKSEQKHRAMVEEQSEIIALILPDGTLDYMNQSFHQFIGADALGGQRLDVLRFMSTADRRLMKLHLGLALAAPEPIAVESRMISAGGKERWISWRLRPQATPGGSAAVYAVGRDVTTRKIAEAALRASEELLARTGRVAGVGGWELDLSSGKLTWSKQVRRIHEVADDFEPTLTSALEFYPAEARETLRRAMDEARFRGTPWDLELSLVPASGHPIYVRAVGEAEFTEDGVPTRLVGTLQDVSDRKRLEQRLEANERFVRGITDNIPIRIAYFDRDKRFQFVNRTLAERFGLAREAMIGRSILDVLPDSYREQFDQALLAALSGQTQRYEYDDHRQNETRRLETQLIPDKTGGEVRGVFGMGVDITHLKDTERTLRERTDVFDNTTDFVAQSDWQGNVRFMNRSARGAAGLDEQAPLTGFIYTRFFTEQSQQQYVRDILPAVKRDGTWVGESTILVAGGRELPVNHMVIAHRDAEGRIARYTSVMRDISKDITARTELARQTATLHAIVEAIPTPVAVWDRDLRYRAVNQAFERWRQSSRDNFLGRTFQEAVGPVEADGSLPWMRRCLAGETVTFDKEYADARVATVTYIPWKLEDGAIGGLIGVAQDITRHREENIRLMLLSERDPLTSLLNRAGFEHYMRGKTEQGDAAALAVVYIDLDHFKPINDRFGHAAGDAVLQEFAARLQQLVRPTDAVARLGGDEFAVTLAGVRDVEAAVKVADKILDMVQQSFSVAGEQVSLGASVGVAFDAVAAGGWTQLVARADAMAYRAKAAGRGQVMVAGDRKMHELQKKAV